VNGGEREAFTSDLASERGNACAQVLNQRMQFLATKNVSGMTPNNFREVRAENRNCIEAERARCLHDISLFAIDPMRLETIDRLTHGVARKPRQDSRGCDGEQLAHAQQPAPDRSSAYRNDVTGGFAGRIIAQTHPRDYDPDLCR
jgi:hypothetical protein